MKIVFTQPEIEDILRLHAESMTVRSRPGLNARLTMILSGDPASGELQADFDTEAIAPPKSAL